VKQVRDGLRGLDVEFASDLADARLIGVLREEVYQVVIDATFDLSEWLRHSRFLSRDMRTPGDPRAGFPALLSPT